MASSSLIYSIRKKEKLAAAAENEAVKRLLSYAFGEHEMSRRCPLTAKFQVNLFFHVSSQTLLGLS
jgi:hypothetical protein